MPDRSRIWGGLLPGPGVDRGRAEPQGFRTSTPPVTGIATSLAVIHFHGRNTETWEAKAPSAAEHFRYLYDKEKFKSWVPTVNQLADKVDRVHVLLNNSYRDFAARDAPQVAELLARLSQLER